MSASGDIFIGARVRHEPSGCVGHVTTYYDDGDLMIYLGPGRFERWPVAECRGLGRHR